uniref:Uncharacterized protein n=1 Tax=Glossina austeni TaxID=7395 RepID=A0A1A9UNG3_GLOAU
MVDCVRKMGVITVVGMVVILQENRSAFVSERYHLLGKIVEKVSVEDHLTKFVACWVWCNDIDLIKWIVLHVSRVVSSRRLAAQSLEPIVELLDRSYAEIEPLDLERSLDFVERNAVQTHPHGLLTPGSLIDVPLITRTRKLLMTTPSAVYY